MKLGVGDKIWVGKRHGACIEGWWVYTGGGFISEDGRHFESRWAIRTYAAVPARPTWPHTRFGYYYIAEQLVADGSI